MVKLTWQGYVRLCQFTLEGLDVGGVKEVGLGVAWEVGGR